jgi:hypothetical protein
MRALVLALLIVLAITAHPSAQTPEDGVRDVISRQIGAFEADDFARAFDFASPMIRGIFGTPERFGAMVRNGYPMVWRPADVRFLGLEERGGALHQRVLITDRAGRAHVLEYEMLQVGGRWAINGVVILGPPQPGV